MRELGCDDEVIMPKGARIRVAVLAVVVATAMLVASDVPNAPPADAAAISWAHVATGGFARPDGGGYWVSYGNGDVRSFGTATSFGNASGLPLKAPILSGAAHPSGTGYWLLGRDGGIFSFGHATFHGSTGSLKLRSPIFAMQPTKSGNGYWLAAGDGGIFSFGDAGYYGSLGNMRLSQPIVGITRSPSGRGYRMVGADGGIFSFGDVPYFGSLPGVGIHVTDVVGLAPTPTNKGYWIVRRHGQIYAFGDAQRYLNAPYFACDPFVGVFANPNAQGIRLVTLHGVTVPFGTAPGGNSVVGGRPWCVTQTACRGLLQRVTDYQWVLATRGPTFSGADGGVTFDVGDGRRVWMFGDTYEGPVDAVSLLPGFHFVRNSVAVEQGSCFTYRLGGTTVVPQDYFPKPRSTEWYWPLDGISDKPHGLVYASVMHVSDASGPWGYRWKILRNDILLLDDTTLALVGVRPMPAGGGLQWGVSMAEDSTYIYLYAVASGARHYVARTTRAHLFDGKWEYGTSSGWSTDARKVYPMRFENFTGVPEKGPLPMLTVEPYGHGFIASAKRCEIFCPDVTAWYGPTAAGPWRAVNSADGRVGWTPVAANQVAYGGHLVKTTAGWLTAWSVNRTTDTIEKDKYGVRVQTPWHLPPPNTIASIFGTSATALPPKNTSPPATLPPQNVRVPVEPGTQVYLPSSSGFASP